MLLDVKEFGQHWDSIMPNIIHGFFWVKLKICRSFQLFILQIQKKSTYFFANNGAEDLYEMQLILQITVGEIVFDTSFESFEEENVNVQINDTEANIDEENWDPEKEADIMLD
ncbi:17012_t:CDS:2 [Gigaspora margarita]|uniref:17012_t:CDS:1 n=1 Tax=Gigaspora margarita TaxID=4874 RepID=A0ABN7W5Z6_GIGMA|nr:17012_t:CDS:2 [Gigaspora margarita]